MPAGISKARVCIFIYVYDTLRETKDCKKKNRIYNIYKGGRRKLRAIVCTYVYVYSYNREKVWLYNCKGARGSSRVLSSSFFSLEYLRETEYYLKVLFRCLGAGPRVKSHETHRLKSNKTYTSIRFTRCIPTWYSEKNFIVICCASL